MAKLRAAVAVEVLVVSGLMSGGGGGVHAQLTDVCDILDSPQRPYLSGAGEATLMRMCGEIPEAPAASRESSGETAKLLSASGVASDDGAGSASAVGGDVQVNTTPDPAPNTTQNEVTIARMPGTPGTLVAGWNDTSHFSFHRCGYAVSTDGGITWADRGPLLNLPSVTLTIDGDPWIRAHHASGNFYFATVAHSDPPPNVPARLIVAVFTGATPGVAPDWPAATDVTPLVPVGTFQIVIHNRAARR